MFLTISRRNFLASIPNLRVPKWFSLALRSHKIVTISLPTSSLPAVPKYEELNVEETFDDALEAGEMRSFLDGQTGRSLLVSIFSVVRRCVESMKSNETSAICRLSHP